MEITKPTEENLQILTDVDLNNPKLYINRELSLLEFQFRVLEEAKDLNNPVLEQVKFLSIVGSNMDELFMVRVGGLQMQMQEGIVNLSIDGLTPAEQLAAIRRVSLNLLNSARDCWHQIIYPSLNDSGIHILQYNELNEKQKVSVKEYFDEVIFPVLTPLGFDPGHPFPHISNLSLNLAVMIRDDNKNEHFARVKVPASLPRLVPIKRSSGSVRRDGTVPHHHYFVWIEQVIAENLDTLFPGMEVLASHPFRVIRNADIEIQELEADDLLVTMTESVRDRRFGTVVSLSYNQEMPTKIRDILINNLRVDPKDIYILDNPLGLSSLSGLSSIDRYDLKDLPYFPVTPLLLRADGIDSSVFDVIRKNNILLHHPYDSFTPVVDFLNSAARDPNVLAIKMTLYRVGRNSPVVRALLEARREFGKQVAVLVELKARFDEESNIGWAKMLEREGVHVVYGLLGLKTHSKIALVVRREGDIMRRYLHLGTGNYNHITAQLYEDFGMFTSDEDLCADVSDVFNYLTGYSIKKEYRKLLVAPINLREQFTALIEREIEHQRNGKEGHLIFKMNALVDKRLTRLLYEASMAGVKVDLIVRGICSIRPGLEGISENIRVISILGRYLEHSRIYYFRNGGDEQIFMGSADLMPRNLNRRVEILFPVELPDLIRHIREDILDIYLNDNVRARIMKPDGTYYRLSQKTKDNPLDTQKWFMDTAHNS